MNTAMSYTCDGPTLGIMYMVARLAKCKAELLHVCTRTSPQNRHTQLKRNIPMLISQP